MKKKLLLIGIFLLFITGCGKNIAVIKEKNLVFEYGKDIYVSDLITIKDGKYKNKKIKYNELGKKKVSINYEDTKGHKDVYEVTIKLVDTTPPLVNSYSNVYVVKNTSPKLENYAFVADNYDRKNKINIIGEYDLSTTGEYNLSFNVIDKAGNATNNEFTLHVLDKYSEKEEYEVIPDNFEDVIKKYKTDSNSIGIDVSYHQGDINWKKVKKANVEFAMIRIGYGPNKDGKMVIDKKFKEYIKQAKKNKIDVGIYFFSYATTYSEARKEANWVIKTLKKEKLDLPIVYDWENWKQFPTCNMNIHDLNRLYDEFSEIIEKKGYETMLYGSKNYLNNMWTTYKRNIWLAHYTEQTDYDKKYMMWQLTEDGVVPGINSSSVDIDILYK